MFVFTHTAQLPFKICKRCSKSFEVYEYKDLPEAVRSRIRNFDENLCILCLEAKTRGFHRFWCKGCDTEVRGSFKDLRSLLNVYGKSFCSDCRNAFFGIYNPANPALTCLLQRIREKRKPRYKIPRYSDKEGEQFRSEIDYPEVVRRLSKSQFKKHQDMLNPKGHRLGPSGKNGAYQIDHIVPVSLCWEYYVPAEAAASIHNLQVVPWFVNISRGNHFCYRKVIGLPLEKKLKK